MCEGAEGVSRRVKGAPGGTQWMVGVPGCEGLQGLIQHFQAGRTPHLPVTVNSSATIASQAMLGGDTWCMGETGGRS